MARRRKGKKGVAGQGRLLLLLTGLIIAMAVLKQGLLLALPVIPIPAADTEIPLITQGPALIVRDEIILAAPVAGTVEWLVSDGTRVPAHRPVARIISGSGMGPIRQELAQVRQQLAALDADAVSRAQDERLAHVATALAGQIQEQRRLLAGGEEPAPAQVNHLADLWAERDELTQAVAAREARREALARQEQTLANMVAAGSTAIRAPAAGTVFHHHQGASGLPVNLEAAYRAAPADIDEWLAAAREDQGETEAAESTVAPGQPLARLATGWKTYLLMAVPEDVGPHLSTGETVQAASPEPDGAPLRGRITALGEPADDGRRSVMVEVVTGAPTLPPEPAAPVWVQWGVLRGKGLPSDALISVGDEQPMVLVRRALPGRVHLEWQPVEVVARDGDMVLVAGLRPGQRVLARPGLLSWVGWYRPGRGDVDAGG